MNRQGHLLRCQEYTSRQDRTGHEQSQTNKQEVPFLALYSRGKNYTAPSKRNKDSYSRVVQIKRFSKFCKIRSKIPASEPFLSKFIGKRELISVGEICVILLNIFLTECLSGTASEPILRISWLKTKNLTDHKSGKNQSCQKY